MNANRAKLYNICKNCINKEYELEGDGDKRPRMAKFTENKMRKLRGKGTYHKIRAESHKYHNKIENIWQYKRPTIFIYGCFSRDFSYNLSFFPRILSIHNRFIDNHLQFINFYCNFKSNVLCAYVPGTGITVIISSAVFCWTICRRNCCLFTKIYSNAIVVSSIHRLSMNFKHNILTFFPVTHIKTNNRQQLSFAASNDRT